MEKIGKYHIVGELGAGGFGAVYKADDPAMGRVVAIKVLHAQDDPNMVKRFRAEARIAANLHHPNIVGVFDFGEENGKLYLVMEYLDGATLARLIDGRAPLSLLERLCMLSEAALGLKAAHARGVLHRDIKPANIMRLADGSVKIMDFGISRTVGNVDTRLTQTGYLVGTPAYMAPEQFTSESEPDLLCDIWAFGVVLYELLTGVNPFHASNAQQIAYRLTTEEPLPLAHYLPGVPQRLEEVARRLLAKKRDSRYQTMEDVCLDLEQIVLELRGPEIERRIAEAEGLIRGGRLDEAQSVVRQVLEMDRANAWARQRRGEIEELARSQAVAGRIKELLDRANAATLTGTDAVAQRRLEEALQLDPSNRDVRERVEEIRANRARVERAAVLLDAARDEFKRGFLARALELASTATDSDPKNEPARQLVVEIRRAIDQANRSQGNRAVQEPPGPAKQPAKTIAWVAGIAGLLALALFLYPKVFPDERTLSVHPSDLSFEYQRGKALPQPATIEVTGKPADVPWTVAASDPWVKVSPAQGKGKLPIQVEVSPTSLAPGEYSAFATVSAKDAPPASIRIHVRVTAESKSAPHGEKNGTGNPEVRRDLRATGTGPRINPVDGLTYVFIPAGEFMMGCSPGDSECDTDEKAPHSERIANGFWLGRTEVTQAAWKQVMKDNPSHFHGDQLPVEQVDWNQASAYCKAIGGRLPTEKEWEYAARAGSAAARYGSLDAVAWYSGNSGSTTHPVGLKQSNAFGLYDMLGNVWEWTADNYDAKTKVVRGGSWGLSTGLVRASVRYRFEPAYRFSIIGFRCAGEFR